MSEKLTVVLVEPEIPQNTGNIARLCTANLIRLVLIEPLGFSLDDKYVKRAGLDYWQHADVTVYSNWKSFLSAECPETEEMLFFSTKASANLYQQDLNPIKFLVFGSETKGLPEYFHKEHSQQMTKIPMRNEIVRSLNLANAVAIATYAKFYHHG